MLLALEQAERQSPMNRDETLALFAKGKDAWNAWAQDMLNKRKELEAKGQWKIDDSDKFIDPDKPPSMSPETESWIAVASTAFTNVAGHFALNFSDFVFPGPANFSKNTFRKTANFDRTQWYGPAYFSNTIFAANVSFESARFLDDALFDEMTANKRTAFSGTNFEKSAVFSHATFRALAQFRRCRFTESFFDHAKFTFAEFDQSTFSSFTYFATASFENRTSFGSSKFFGETNFENCTFNGIGAFGRIVANDTFLLSSAKFPKGVTFLDAKFVGRFLFSGVVSDGHANFRKAAFSGEANFRSTRFNSEATFHQSHFDAQANFEFSNFGQSSDFGKATFVDTTFDFANLEGATLFSETEFNGTASFVAIQNKGGFALTGARFDSIPNFTQAHFQEAPDFQNAVLPVSTQPWWRAFIPSQGNKETLVRWRALRRLATQGHDHEREQLFFSEEIKARRHVEDFPFGKNLGKFWLGWLYEIFSDFGRSVRRPLAWWLACVGLFGFFNFAMHFRTHLDGEAQGVTSWLWAIVSRIFGSEQSVLKAAHGAAGEPWSDALLLAFHKGLVITGLGGNEFLSHAYIRLFGRHDGLTVIPDSVIYVGFLQTVISTALIFLALLAIRNHFRIK